MAPSFHFWDGPWPRLIRKNWLAMNQPRVGRTSYDLWDSGLKFPLQFAKLRKFPIRTRLEVPHPPLVTREIKASKAPPFAGYPYHMPATSLREVLVSHVWPHVSKMEQILRWNRRGTMEKNNCRRKLKADPKSIVVREKTGARKPILFRRISDLRSDADRLKIPRVKRDPPVRL